MSAEVYEGPLMQMKDDVVRETGKRREMLRYQVERGRTGHSRRMLDEQPLPRPNPNRRSE